MTEWLKKSFLRTLACIVMMVLVVNFTSFPQGSKTDLEKLYADIVGDYNFSVNGMELVFSFYVEDGKLMGAPQGQDPAELKPVEGEKLKFIVITPNGESALTFVKDEKSKTITCKVSSMQGEFEGTKNKK